MHRLGRHRYETPTRCAGTRVVFVVTLAWTLVFNVACETAPVRAWEAGRLYVDGTAALDRGEHARAIVALEEAARLVPEASEVRNHLGLAYRGAGQFDRARGEFEAALELDCDNEAARANLAHLESRKTQNGGSRDGG